MADIDYSDSPTDNDKLGFAEPAARLAEKITGFPADKPMVVGIEGKWGEGKSSFLLMMEKHWREQECLAPESFRTKLDQFVQEKILRKKPARQIKLIKFDPWWFSGKENLLDKLLKEMEGQEPWFYSPLRSLLKSLEKQASADNSWLKSKLEIVALLLASGVSVALNPMLDWFGGSALNAIKPWLESGKAVLLTLGLFWMIKLGLRLAIAKLTPPEGFDARKKKLEALLKKDRFQRVVFIDDLDRLPADEVQEMFRVIKSVANFPNIVYVLAYDKYITSAALDKYHSGRGELFLEKIVQMPLILPEPKEEKAQKLYQEILSFDPEMKKFFEEMKLGSNFARGWTLVCSNFIDQTRQAKRLLGVFHVNFDLNIGVSAIYFLFLEALRLKNEGLYIKVCRALVLDGFLERVQTTKNNNQETELELLKTTAFDKDVSSKEKECLEFFIGVNFSTQTSSSALWSIFSGSPLHNSPITPEQCRHIRRAITGYMQRTQSKELNKLQELGNRILNLNSKEELIALIQSTSSADAEEALRTQLFFLSSNDPNTLAQNLVKIIMIMAEVFDGAYDKILKNNQQVHDQEAISFINSLAAFIYNILSVTLDSLAIHKLENQNLEHIKKFPLFYGKNQRSAHCIKYIWSKYPPESFLAWGIVEQGGKNRWVVNLIEWMVKTHKDSYSKEFGDWLDKLPEITNPPENSGLFIINNALYNGFHSFLVKNLPLPKILHHNKISHLVLDLRSAHIGNDAYQKIINDFLIEGS